MKRAPACLLLSPVFALLALTGAGCTTELTAPQVATTLQTRVIDQSVPKDVGFGALPELKLISRTGTIQLSTPVPVLPTKVTVIRPKHGTPNDTQFRNLANALGISDGFIGNLPEVKDLTLAWKDDKGFRWTYRGLDRTLEFVNETAPNEPVTVATLPTNDAVLNVANTFLVERGIRIKDYGDPTVAPDWNLWWYGAQANGQCIDRNALSSIRLGASSAPFIIAHPPALPASAKTQCVSPEFPAKLSVAYDQLVDSRDVVKTDGSFISGVEIVVDVSRMNVVSGHIILTGEPDRSDYPALTASQATDRLQHGGVTGASGNIIVTTYDFASLNVTDPAHPDATYLIPSLIAHGTRTKADRSMEPVRIVVPLVAQ